MLDKKEHIIDTAITLFARKGFEGTSIRDLAAAADVNVAMVNYYFGSKEKLFENLIEYKARTTRLVLDEIVQKEGLTTIQKLHQIVDNYVVRIFQNRNFHRVIHQELLLGNRESLQNAIVNVLFPNSLVIRDLIETGIRKGEFKKVDPELTVATVIGTINNIVASRKFCNKFINREDSYIPYDDPKFQKRVADHLKQLLDNYLLK